MKKHLWLRRAAVLVYCAFLFYLSSRTEYPDVKNWYPGWMPDPSVIAHFCLYAGLAIVAWLDFRYEPANWLSRRAPYFAIIFCSLYGASDEFHQSFVPNRDCTLADWATDTAGAAAAMAFIALTLRIKKKKSV